MLLSPWDKKQKQKTERQSPIISKVLILWCFIILTEDKNKVPRFAYHISTPVQDTDDRSLLLKIVVMNKQVLWGKHLKWFLVCYSVRASYGDGDIFMSSLGYSDSDNRSHRYILYPTQCNAHAKQSICVPERLSYLDSDAAMDVKPISQEMVASAQVCSDFLWDPDEKRIKIHETSKEETGERKRLDDLMTKGK